MDTTNNCQLSPHGDATLIDVNKTVHYTFETEQQSDLYGKSRTANLDSYYFDAFVPRILIVIGGVIIVTGVAISFVVATTTVMPIFSWLAFLWGINAIYYVYNSNRLFQIARQLEKQVDAEIPHTTTYSKKTPSTEETLDERLE